MNLANGVNCYVIDDCIYAIAMTSCFCFDEMHVKIQTMRKYVHFMHIKFGPSMLPFGPSLATPSRKG